MKLNLALNKVNTASFQIRLDDPLGEPVMATLGYLKIYFNKVLIFFGPIITATEVGEGDVENASVQVNASGPEWIFAQRLAARTKAAAVKSEPAPELSDIFAEYIVACDAENDTHIWFPSEAISGGSTFGYETPLYRQPSEILNDMVNTTDGFDWRVTPIENYFAGGVSSSKIGKFEAAKVLNTFQPGTIFEWGTGLHNVTAYSRAVDRSTLLNRAYHILSEGPEVEHGLITSDPTLGKESIERWGLQEGVISASLLNESMRQELVNEHVTVRRNPRQTITFQPNADPVTPSLGRDFNLGDSVTARIGYQGSLRYQSMVRVWAAEFTLDENLKETHTLVLSDT
jgi:hypothetical protein